MLYKCRLEPEWNEDMCYVARTQAVERTICASKIFEYFKCDLQ